MGAFTHIVLVAVTLSTLIQVTCAIHPFCIYTDSFATPREPVSEFSLLRPPRRNCNLTYSQLNDVLPLHYGHKRLCDSIPLQFDMAFRGYYPGMEVLFDAYQLNINCTDGNNGTFRYGDVGNWSLPEPFTVITRNQTNFSMHGNSVWTIAADWLHDEQQKFEYHEERMEAKTKFLLTTSKYKTILVKYKLLNVSMGSTAPHKGMLHAFRNLPDDLAGNEMAYLNFLQKYGIAVRTSSTFGGLIEVLVTEDELSQKNPAEIVSSQLKFNNTTIYTTSPSTVSSLDEWVTNVEKNPILLESSLTFIGDFIQPNKHSPKKQNLNTLSHSMILHHRLGLSRKSIKILPPGKIHKYLSELLESETEYVCKNPIISEIVDKGVKDNMLFRAFLVGCVRYSHHRFSSVLFDWEYKLLPGVCLTKLPQKITSYGCVRCEAKVDVFEINTCVKGYYTLPFNFACINFYKSSQCQGEPFKVISNKDNSNFAIERAIADSSSFSYCE